MAKVLVYNKRKTVRVVEQHVFFWFELGDKNSQIFNYKLVLLNSNHS